MAIWIVGCGIVGRRIERMLAEFEVRIHDPRIEPTPLVDHGDVAVLAHPVDHAPLARAFALRGASVVTVGDGLDDTRELMALDHEFTSAGATLVIGAALTPGLSGLLARYLSFEMANVDEIHVAVHGTAGPSCARDHHRSLNGRAVSWREDGWRYSLGGGGRALCWFPEPVGALDCFHAEIASPVLLHHSFPEAQRIDARRSARRRDRLTARLPMLRPPHREGRVGALQVEVRGSGAGGERVTRILGVAELVGTASAAIASVFATAASAGELPDGMVVTSDAGLDTVRLLRRVQDAGVRLQEFTGVPQPS
ncbi:hypothetical protein [Ilumatobacter sp.]|uniref:hypothetical protein n=1 Tax=Ilumatobacter sp. TaxID=1967498 RepID=UPI003AF5C417